MAGSRLNRQLGDKHLDPKETVVKLREELLSQRENDKIYGHDELVKAERSQGSRMPYGEFIRRLQCIFPELLVKDGAEGNVALYRPKTATEKIVDGYDLSLPEWYNYHKYVTGCPKDFLPEWGHLTTDTDGIANREVRGWRSMLISFIKSHAVTYDAVVKEFGNPESDQRSNLWFEQLEDFKACKGL